MIIRVIDTETTGVDHETDRVVELAFMQLPENKEQPPLYYNTFINPGIPIPPTASAVHHIVDADVADAPVLNNVLDQIAEQHGDADVYVAHNAQFDRSFLSAYQDKPWICTYRLARHLWPDAPGHSNQVLRYWLELPICLPKDSPMHRALPDAIVTGQLFRREMREIKQRGMNLSTPSDIAAYADGPILLPRIPFGKHRDTPWNELPLDYLRWMQRQSDWDADVQYTLNMELQRRG